MDYHVCPRCQKESFLDDIVARKGCPKCGLGLRQWAEWLGFASVKELFYEMTDGYPEDFFVKP